MVAVNMERNKRGHRQRGGIGHIGGGNCRESGNIQVTVKLLNMLREVDMMRIMVFLLICGYLLTTNMVGAVSTSIKLRNNAQNNNNHNNNGEKCEHSNKDNKSMAGVKCDFEEGDCGWTWSVPRKEETGFRNMTPTQVIAKMHKLGEWAFRGPTMDSQNKTDGMYYYTIILYLVLFHLIYIGPGHLFLKA